MTCIVLISGLMPWSPGPAACRPVSRAPAAIEQSLAAIAVPSSFFGDGNFVPASFRAPPATPPPPKFNVENYIPIDLRPTGDMSPAEKNSQVFGRIADQSVSSLINSPEFRSSALGNVTTEVEKNVKKEVVVRGSGPSGIEHKFNVQLQAFQSTAKVEYRGLASVNLAYRMSDSIVDLEISEPLSKTQKLTLAHSAGPLERISQIRLSWGF